MEKFIQKKYLTWNWNKYKNEKNINTNPHQLRHAFATRLVESGIDFKTIQYIMGHTDIRFTLQQYTDIRKQQIINAKQILDNKKFI